MTKPKVGFGPHTKTTTQRGYGAAHRAERARRVKTHSPASPCSRCGKPLGPERRPGERASRWHLPHLPDRSGYYPGLWCRRCNIQEATSRAGKKGHAARYSKPRPTLRPAVSEPFTASREW